MDIKNGKGGTLVDEAWDSLTQLSPLILRRPPRPGWGQPPTSLLQKPSAVDSRIRKEHQSCSGPDVK